MTTLKKTLICVALMTFTFPLQARNLFLNGKDISSARGQKLEKVSIFISDSGDVFITAPQYQVYEEKTFVPISPAGKRMQHPEGLPKTSELANGASPVSTVVPTNSKIDGEEVELEKKPGTRTPE